MDTSESETDFERELREEGAAWRTILENELLLLFRTRENVMLWNQLVGIKYGRPFRVIGMRYAYDRSMGPPQSLRLLHYVYDGGPLDRVESFSTNYPHVSLRYMHQSAEGALQSEPMPMGPIDAEIAHVQTEIAQVNSMLSALVECRPPYGADYRAARRSAAAAGLGRYSFRPRRLAHRVGSPAV